MKVYVYGTYVQGYSKRRVKEFEGVTMDPYKAFRVCYEIGLDGNDYFLIEYDVDKGKSEYIYINSAKHDRIWRFVKRDIENGVRRSKKLDAMRAEDV